MHHARHRSPGNGYTRSGGSMGMGVGGASRISPDTSARNHSFYSSEYRSFNTRVFGRGQGHPKSFRQPPQPTPQKWDVLMEAGRLAAEYLVSKGLLPQNALSGKWQNGSFKRQTADYQDFRQQEDLMQEGRTSAHSRLGSGASDAGSSRRRYPDEFNSRNHVKGRRRGEYYRSYGSEWSREYGRSRMSPGMEGEDDTVSGQFEEQQVSNDVDDGMQKSGPSGFAPESEEAADMESGMSKYSYPDETASKASSSSAVKEEIDIESSKGGYDDMTNLNMGKEGMKDSNSDCGNEKQIVLEDLPNQQSAVDGDMSGKDGSDLLTLSKFANVPTKTRSALAYKASKVGQILSSEEEDASDIGAAKGSEDLVQDGACNISAGDVLANTNHDSNCPDPEISKSSYVQSSENVGELGTAYGAVQGKWVRFHSFPDRAFMQGEEQESSMRLLGFGRSASVKERGEKRAAEDGDVNEAAKKPREWLPSLVTTADEQLHISNSSENTVSLQEERASPNLPVNEAATQDNFVNGSQFPEAAGEPCMKYAQEKQFFPSSFKICDLNLMEASEMNDAHRSDRVPTYPSAMANEKAAAQVDIDLSISNANMSGEYARCMSDGKQVEIIDLENDSILEDEPFDNPQRKYVLLFLCFYCFSLCQVKMKIPPVLLI